ncbi:MAG TPA: amidohydrolase family protein [Gemmatimonadaceae bacterium]|nr:amidohydrolase family protein [Gemmatimonadaceae bacterium]
MIVWQTRDSARVRYMYTDRNRGSRSETRYHMAGGLPVGIEYRTVLADGTASEPTSRVELFGDSVRTWSPSKTTTTKAEPGVDYTVSFARELTPFDELRIVKRLLREPNRTIKIPGDSTLSLSVVRDMTVPTAHGDERVRLVAISINKDYAPDFVWLDSRGELFATSVGWFITVKPGAERALPVLRKVEAQLRDAAAQSLNKRLLKPTAGVLAIKNGSLFDSDRGVMRPNTTVLVRHDRIIAVGPADSVAIPAGATVIDATGKTIMPGMWDMHGHLQASSQSSSSPMQLSFGVTTVRDLGSDVDLAVANRDHADAGTIPGPREILSGFIDGPGAWAGPTGDIVRTEAEARALVARFDSLGYKQIKLYNLVQQDLVPTFAAEAHKRGMRLSGHIPRGLSVRSAIELGFDEVNHAAFLFSTFYPDSLYTPKMRAYSLVATTVAPNVDVDGQAMTDMIADLVRHHTVIDGTWAIWVVGSNNGIAQSVGAGTSADAAKSDANYMHLLKRLYDAGVTLVPGTDDWGSMTFDSELELYEKVGIPTPVVLQIATIVPARVMKDDRDYGSIAVGKVADLFIVNGSPAEHVKDVRNVEQVVRAGRLYDANDLRDATGLAKPKP